MYSQSDYNTPLHNNASDEAAAGAAGYSPPKDETGWVSICHNSPCTSKSFNGCCLRHASEVGYQIPY